MPSSLTYPRPPLFGKEIPWGKRSLNSGGDCIFGGGKLTIEDIAFCRNQLRT